MIKQWIRTHRYLCILMAVFLVGSAAFAYTYVQPRYTATVLEVGNVQHKDGSNWRHRRTGRSYDLVALTVRYTDGNGQEIVADASYRCESQYYAPRVGDEVVLVHGFHGLVRYPFTTLHYLSGFLTAGSGLLLGMEGFVHLYAKKKEKEKRQE